MQISTTPACRGRLALSRLLRWRGGWALADQAVSSLGNYLTLFVIPNFLSTADFGAFALMFGVLLFLNTVHNALIAYPFSVRGSVAEQADFRQLLSASLLLTALLAVPLALAVCVAATLLHRPWLIALALPAMLLWQIQETLRRAHMSRLDYARAIPGDAVSYLGQAAILLALGLTGWLSIYSAFVVMAITSGLSIVVQVVQLAPTRPDFALVKKAAAEFWDLGRWVVCSAAVGLLTVQAMPWTLATFHGVSAVARFQMLANLLALSNPLVIGLTSLIVPSVARAAKDAALGIAARYAGLGLALLLPYFAMLIAAPNFFLQLAYRGAPGMGDMSQPLRLFAVAYALIFPAHMCMALLNGLGRTRLTFAAQCVFAVSTVAISLPLAARFGLIGAVYGGLFPAAAYLVTAFYMIRNTTRFAWPDGSPLTPTIATPFAPRTEAAA